MKTKTSITLSADLLRELDSLTGRGSSRSAFIERALRSYIRDCRHAATDARELRAINRQAEALNAEAAEIREYQAPWPDED